MAYLKKKAHAHDGEAKGQQEAIIALIGENKKLAEEKMRDSLAGKGSRRAASGDKTAERSK